MWIASVLLSLGFDVTKSLGDTQASWKDSVWSIDHVWIRLTLGCLLADQGVVLTWLVSDGLHLLVITLCDCECLVDLASCLKNPLLLQ